MPLFFVGAFFLPLIFKIIMFFFGLTFLFFDVRKLINFLKVYLALIISIIPFIIGILFTKFSLVVPQPGRESGSSEMFCLS